jgi:hypothetical protein
MPRRSRVSMEWAHLPTSRGSRRETRRPGRWRTSRTSSMRRPSRWSRDFRFPSTRTAPIRAAGSPRSRALASDVKSVCESCLDTPASSPGPIREAHDRAGTKPSMVSARGTRLPNSPPPPRRRPSGPQASHRAGLRPRPRPWRRSEDSSKA